MALRCVSRYRNHGLPWAQPVLHVHPGEVLAALTPAQEEYLLRDAPGCFEQLDVADVADASEALGAGYDTPPADKMVRRERASRKTSERASGPVMGSADHPALVRPGSGKG